MLVLRTMGLGWVAVAVAACGFTGTENNPTGDVHDGVRYTATVAEIPGGTAMKFSVTLYLENTTSVTKTRTYPAACPMRLRLYRISDNAKLYDETRVACSTTAQASIVIGSAEKKDISSGVRFGSTVAGDTLPFTNYSVKVVPTTEGTSVFEISAGTLNLRAQNAVADRVAAGGM